MKQTKNKKRNNKKQNKTRKNKKKNRTIENRKKKNDPLSYRRDGLICGPRKQKHNGLKNA